MFVHLVSERIGLTFWITLCTYPPNISPTHNCPFMTPPVANSFMLGDWTATRLVPCGCICPCPFTRNISDSEQTTPFVGMNPTTNAVATFPNIFATGPVHFSLLINQPINSRERQCTQHPFHVQRKDVSLKCQKNSPHQSAPC